MAQMTLRIGADASCADGACGQVSRIIVNPAAREVTHLAVDPKRRPGPGRLVPVDLVDTAGDQIRLRCTLTEFQRLQPAEETEVVPELDPTGRRASPPSRVRWVSRSGPVLAPPGPGGAGQEVTVDSVPSGAVDIRRSLTVCAADGDIGPVQGLVVEAGGHRVTHVLIQKGHVLGRKEVAVPVGGVTKIGTLLIHLSLTKHQVDSLPAVDVDHQAG